MIYGTALYPKLIPASFPFTSYLKMIADMKNPCFGGPCSGVVNDAFEGSCTVVGVSSNFIFSQTNKIPFMPKSVSYSKPNFELAFVMKESLGHLYSLKAPQLTVELPVANVLTICLFQSE